MDENGRYKGHVCVRDRQTGKRVQVDLDEVDLMWLHAGYKSIEAEVEGNSRQLARQAGRGALVKDVMPNAPMPFAEQVYDDLEDQAFLLGSLGRIKDKRFQILMATQGINDTSTTATTKVPPKKFPVHLTNEDRQRVVEILESYRDAFGDEPAEGLNELLNLFA